MQRCLKVPQTHILSQTLQIRAACFIHHRSDPVVTASILHRLFFQTMMYHFWARTAIVLALEIHKRGVMSYQGPPLTHLTVRPAQGQL